jgi:nitrogen fixation protein NifB
MMEATRTVPDISKHPCFSPSAKGSHGRIHLPVAPKCNVQCNFCHRKYDCSNESRPGVTSRILTPEQAAEYVLEALRIEPRLSVAGIAGPGDPMANPETFETMRLIRDVAPEMLLCVSTNGLGLTYEKATMLSDIGASHVTVTVNSVDPELSGRIYAWVRDGKRTYRGAEGGRVLLERQEEGIRMLAALGMTVKVNTVTMPGINDHHVVEVAKWVAALGANVHNCIPLTPAPGSAFEHLEEPSAVRMMELRALAGRHIKQMSHCSRCRADAVGLLGEANSPEIASCLDACATRAPRKVRSRERFVLVNQHLGVADRFLVYQHTQEGFELVEERPAPEFGTGDRRWKDLGELLSDCRAVLTAAAGNAPRQALSAVGVEVFEMEGMIDDCLEGAWNGEWAVLKARRNGMGGECGCGKVREPGSGCG